MKRIENLRNKTNKKLDFRLKNEFLQNQIEYDINFFNCRVSTGTLGQLGINLDEIRKTLAQNHAILEQRDEDILKAMVERRLKRLRSIELIKEKKLKKAEYEASLKFW